MLWSEKWAALFFTLPSIGRVVAGLPATGWGDELGVMQAALLPVDPPTPSPSPLGGGEHDCELGGV